MNIIHIGFPKTATTFLQQDIFRQLPASMHYVYSKHTKDLFFRMCNEDETVLDFQALKSEFADLCRTDAAITNLFSHEPLTGLHYQTSFVNRTLIAQRLKKLGFNKVIITIRNQYDVLDSTYRQYIKSGGVLRFSEYINFTNVSGRYYFDPAYYNYDPVLSLYTKLFGPENVCILQYEEINSGCFFDKLTGFLEIPDHKFAINDYINRSLSVRATNALRIINHFTYNSFRPSHLISRRFSTGFFYRFLKKFPARPKTNGSFIDDEIRCQIFDYYKKSNSKIAKDYSLNLHRSYPQ